MRTTPHPVRSPHAAPTESNMKTSRDPNIESSIVPFLLILFLLFSFSENIFLLEALLPVYCMTLWSAGSGCIHQNSVLHYFWMSATVKAIWLHCLCLLWAAVWIWWWPIGGQIKADRRRRTPPLDAPLIILTLSWTELMPGKHLHTHTHPCLTGPSACLQSLFGFLLFFFFLFFFLFDWSLTCS